MILCIMMLENAATMLENPVIGDLERYVGKVLHDRLKVDVFSRAGELPIFMEHTYELLEGHIVGRRCVFLVAGTDLATPVHIGKHLNLVRNLDDVVAILVSPGLTSTMRDRLIGQGVPFIVPGNQLYIPELAIDLRERMRSNRHLKPERLGPTAQAVIFHHLLRNGESAATPQRLSEILRFQPESIGRAFNELEALGLARSEPRGRERHISFNFKGRELLDAALPGLRAPFSKQRFIRGDREAFAKHMESHTLMLAGELALSALSDLTRPAFEAYAVYNRDWKEISTAEAFQKGFIVTEWHAADFVVESWLYDPACLSDETHVDPLSLYAQFHNHEDPRVRIAADKLLVCLSCQ